MEAAVIVRDCRPKKRFALHIAVAVKARSIPHILRCCRHRGTDSRCQRTRDVIDAERQNLRPGMRLPVMPDAQRDLCEQIVLFQLQDIFIELQKRPPSVIQARRRRLNTLRRRIIQVVFGLLCCLRYLEGLRFFFSSYILLSASVMSWKIVLPSGGTVMQAPILRLSS